MKLTFYIIFFFIAINLCSQDSSKQNVTSFLNYDLYSASLQPTKADTEFFLVHDYLLYNQNFYAYLGNGTTAAFPFFPLFYYQSPFWFQPYRIHFKSISQLYIHTYKPFTFIKFAANTNRTYNEEYVELTHSQNIKPNWNVLFKGKTHKNIGRFANQDNRLHNFYISSWYFSKNYQILTNYTFARTKIKEFGGLQNLQFITDSLYPYENGIGYRSNASNVLTYQQFNLNHSLALTKFDSTLNKTRLYIIHRIKYEKIKKIFNDIPDSYYANIYFDSTKTYDSLFFRTLNQKIGISISKDLQKKSRVFAYCILNQPRYVSVSQSKNFNNQGFGIEAVYKQKKTLWYVNGEYFVNGFTKKDIILQGLFQQLLSSSDSAIKIMTSLTFLHQHHDYFLYHFSTNHFRWDNNVPAYQSIEGAIYLKNKKQSIELLLKQYTNSVYFDTSLMPVIDSSQHFYIGLKSTIHFSWKNLHLNNTFLLQHIFLKKLYLPVFVGFHTFYYENTLFKKVLWYQLGFDMSLQSFYNAYSFQPAINVFYKTEHKLGNYPYFNVFLNFKLKRARIFLKIDHLNYQWIRKDYSQIYLYPLPVRTFKFGVLWSFYD